MRLFLLLSLVVSLNSCDVLFRLMEEEPLGEAVDQLILDYRDNQGLLGNFNVSGTVKNTSKKVIRNVKIKTTVTHKDGTVSTDQISITAIDPGATNTFSEKIYATNDDRLKLTLQSACY